MGDIGTSITDPEYAVGDVTERPWPAKRLVGRVSPA
jgi:hypothetical protein